MQTDDRQWSVAIFAARESIGTLTSCVRAVLAACEKKSAVIDVLVNGNRPLAEQASQLQRLDRSTLGNNIIRVWFIPLGDKAHTWNEYIHQICKPSAITYFVDGYAEVYPDALSLIEEGIHNAPHSLGATGVPTSGRSAETLRRQLLSEGGIHGNLYALRGAAILLFKQCGFRMPLGLYRTDPLIGAVLNFQFNPGQFDWDPSRIFVHPKATWRVNRVAWFEPKELLGHLKRKLRQAQGVLENHAIRDHLAVRKRSPESLPATTSDMINRWITENPRQATRVFLTQPLTIHATRKLKLPRDWSGRDLTSVLIVTIAADPLWQTICRVSF